MNVPIKFKNVRRFYDNTKFTIEYLCNNATKQKEKQKNILQQMHSIIYLI